VEDDISIDSDTLLVTDFVNLRIKLAHSFKCAHKGKVRACVHMSECSDVYENLCLYCISHKKMFEIELRCKSYLTIIFSPTKDSAQQIKNNSAKRVRSGVA
jgi:hypothetical protein